MKSLLNLTKVSIINIKKQQNLALIKKLKLKKNDVYFLENIFLVTNIIF